ncbi:RHS repeat protein, partial [Vibrio agarivorans]
GCLARSISPSGLEVFYDYEYGETSYDYKRLWKIYDNCGRRVEIDWWTDDWVTTVSHYLDEKLEYQITLEKEGNGAYKKRLRWINFPEIDSVTEISYDWIEECAYDVINSVEHSSGLFEELTYFKSGHQLPQGAPINSIPYVKVYTVDGGSDSKPQVTEYDYSAKNYLGYGGELKWVEGEDTLFKAESSYYYTTTETINGSKVVTREYNKYHLLNKAIYTDNDVLYRQDDFVYFADLDKRIEDQPATYSLLKSQTTTHHFNGQSKAYTKNYDYDDYANLLLETEVDGSSVVNSYYLASGESNSCPAHPYGMVAMLKSQSFIPTKSSGKYSARTSSFTYDKLQCLGGDESRYFLLISTQSDPNESTEFQYYTDDGCPEKYGRLKAKYETFNDHTFTTNYAYEYEADGLKKIASVITHDDFTVSESEKVDYLFGKTVEHIDSDNIISFFEYDSLGRKKSSRTAVGTNYEATQSYQYFVGKNENRTLVTDAKGNIFRTDFNNAGKVIAEWQTISFNGTKQVQPLFKKIRSTQYNNFGMASSQTEFDYYQDDEGEEVTKSLTTIYQYDVNGEISKIIHQDGRQEFVTQDPVKLQTI